MLELVHLEDKAKVYPDLLSGGEQQRVAVARALAHAPKLVIAKEEKAVIAKAQEALKKSPAVPCTACRYCCDGCPMGIAIPDVFKALNTIRLYGEEDRAKNYYKKLLETSGKAEDCVQCGQCESVCPQHLPIIDLLKEASEKLDVPVTK